MGGDFYNALKVGNKVVAYVSDVSGHGLEGTLLSAFVKEAIDSYVILKPEEIEAEKILYHLNRQYRRENYPDDYFVCIFLVVIDLNSMELTYTGAGFQELPLVQTGSGEKLRLHTEGPPISSTIPEEFMDYTAGKLTLSPGTTVLVSTDGITEQMAGEEQYSSRLEQVFYEHSCLEPEIILCAIKEDFYRFNGGSLQADDDITLSIIHAEPEEKRELFLKLDSNVEALSNMRQDVLNFLPDTDKAELFLIGLHELTANAIEHGNQLDPKKQVHVHCELQERYLLVSVTDEGEGFDWRQAVMGRNELSDLQEEAAKRGRGLGFLVTKAATDYFYYYYNEQGNMATSIKLR